jgi:hypothetical protein
VTAKLPFVVQPRLSPILDTVGSEESGKIQIERRGYLTSGERAFMAQARNADDTSSKLVALSRKAAAKFKLDLSKAYELVSKAISGNTENDPKVEKIEESFPDELSDVFRALTSSQAKESILQATCLMVYRVDADWTIQDTMALHPDLLEGIAALYVDEENKSIEALDASLTATPSIEEIEKKQKPEPQT